MLGTNTGFAGRDGFQWWVGEVEDNNDPAQLGRVKVRIFGWYTKAKVGEDGSSAYLEEMPREVLPWATVLLPNDRPQTKNAGSTCELQPGATVMGFFLDGDEAQLPCVLGAFRGFKHAENKGTKDGRGNPQDMPATVIADPTVADQFKTNTPQKKDYGNQDVNAGHPFVKSQGATAGSATGGEEHSRGAVSRAEVENPFNVYSNPIGPPSMEGGIADGTHGPGTNSNSFTKDLKRMLTDLGVQIGSLGADDSGNLVSAITGHVQAGNNILKGISNISNYVVNAVTGMVAPIKDYLAQKIQEAIGKIVNLLSNLIPLGVVTTVITLIKKIITDIFCQPVPGWLDAVSSILSDIGGFVDSIFGVIMNAINKVFNMISDYVTKALQNIQKAICKVLNTVTKVFDIILSAVQAIPKIQEVARAVDTLFKIDFTQLNFANVLNLISLIVDIIASFVDCGRKARKPKSQGWVPLLGTTECADTGAQLAGPGGAQGEDCSSGLQQEGNSGNFFDKFFQNMNPFLMETKMFLNGAREIDDATPGKEKRIRSGPGGVTTFEDKQGNVHKNVPSNETAIFGRDLIQNVKNNLVHTIEGDYYLKVMGDFHLEVNGSFNEHTSNGAGGKAEGKNYSGNPLGKDNNQWTKQATTAIDAAVSKLQDASKNVNFEAGEKEAKSVQTKAGDHEIAYNGDLTLQGNRVRIKGISGITMDAPDVHTSATTITNKATGEIVNEASWITSFLTCGRMDVIAIFQTMPVFTGSYSLVNGSIVDITMDGPMNSICPSMHVRMALGTKGASGMADIVTGSGSGAHMTLVATPTGGIGEIVTGGSGAIVNQVSSGLLSHGVGTGLAAFGCSLGPTQIYGLPVMLN